MSRHPIEILLVEDNAGEVELTKEAFQEEKLDHNLHVVESGAAVLEFLRQEGQYREAARPDLILLDLNLPGKSGRQLLADIKADEQLKTIPVIILTTSAAESDIRISYQLHANCFIVKPIDVEQFFNVIHMVTEFWFRLVELPPKE